MLSARQRACQLAEDLVKGRGEFFVKVLQLKYCLSADGSIISEKDLDLLIAIDSEVDHLPIGEVRKLWHPDVLPEKDEEIARCEELWRDQVHALCAGILQRCAAQ